MVVEDGVDGGALALQQRDEGAGLVDVGAETAGLGGTELCAEDVAVVEEAGGFGRRRGGGGGGCTSVAVSARARGRELEGGGELIAEGDSGMEDLFGASCEGVVAVGGAAAVWEAYFA